VLDVRRQAFGRPGLPAAQVAAGDDPPAFVLTLDPGRALDPQRAVLGRAVAGVEVVAVRLTDIVDPLAREQRAVGQHGTRARHDPTVGRQVPHAAIHFDTPGLRLVKVGRERQARVVSDLDPAPGDGTGANRRVGVE